MMRVLMYSQDGMGLGHLRRACNIAREILARAPNSAILVISDSPAVSFFPPLNGMDYLKLPTIVKTGDTTWRTGSLAHDIGATIKLRSHLIRDAFLQFRPDLVLVDHMPVGALGELIPMLDCAARGRHSTRLFLGLRDVLDDPEVIRRVWGDLGAYDYLANYEAVLIYGNRDMYDAASAYDISPHARQVVYCDYVTKADSEVSADGDKRFVLLTGGGGADAYPLVRTFIESFLLLARDGDLGARVLPGPNMSCADLQSLIDQADPSSVEVADGYRDARPWISSASAIVSMAGYNSLCEALQVRAKALIVPRQGPSAEQRMRTKIFARLGLVASLDPDELTVEALAQALRLLLDEGTVPDPANIPPLDGAERVAALLLDGMGVQAEDSLAGARVA